jgi:hypothetical protein
VAISQLFLLFTTPTISSFAPILIGITYLLTNRKIFKQVDYATTLNYEVIFEILVLAMLLFSTFRLWLMPVSLSLVTVRFAQRRPTCFRVLFSSLAVIVGIVVSMHMQTGFWWYTNSNDSAYFESISWSINQWGLFENPGYVGGSIAQYHWLAYAWTGHISQVAHLESWQSLNIVSPIFCVVAAVGVVGSVVRENWKLLPNMRVLVIYCGVSSIGIVVSVTSLNYSLIGLMILALIVRQLSTISFAKKLIVLIYLLSVVLLSKITSGLVGIALILSFAPFFPRFRARISKLGILIGPMVLLILTFVLNYLHSSNYASSTNIDNLRNAIEQLKSPYFIPVFAALLYLMLHATHTQQKAKRIETLTTLLIFVFSLIYFLFRASPEGEYIIYAAATLVLLDFYLLNFSTYGLHVGHITVPLIGLGLVAIGFWFYRHPVLGNVLFTNSFLNSIVRATNQFGIGVFALVAVLIALVIVPHNSGKLIAYGVLVCALLNVGIQFNSGWVIVHQSSNTYEASGGNSAPHANPNLRLLSAFVKSNTDSDIVLASNNFCCPGSAWFDKDLLELRAGNLNFDESSLGGANFLLPAYTQRKFLVQGPRFVYQNFSNDLEDRMKLSLGFANNPTMDTVLKLKTYGVKGFVVNLSLTQIRDWSQFANTLYANDEFVFMTLK